MTGLPGLMSTSATGAKSMLMPQAAISRPMNAAARSVASGLPRPSSAAEGAGAKP